MPHQRRQSRETVGAPVWAGVGLEDGVGAGIGNGFVSQPERILEIGKNLGFGLGGIGTAQIATSRWFLPRHLLGPGLIGARDVLHLLAKRAHVFEFPLRRLEGPLVLRHGFRQRGEIMLDALPNEVNGIRDSFRFGWTLLRDCDYWLH